MGAQQDVTDLAWAGMLGDLEPVHPAPGQDVRVKLAQDAASWPVAPADQAPAVKSELGDVDLEVLLQQAVGGLMPAGSLPLTGLKARANSGMLLRTMMEQAGSNMLPESFDSQQDPFLWRLGDQGAAAQDMPECLAESPASEAQPLSPRDSHSKETKAEISSAKERARAAQKRFRHRQKERSRNQQKQLDELSTQVKSLQQERHAVLQRNKVLEHLVQVHVRHQQLLRMDAQAMPAQQHLLLGELAAFLNMVEGDEACCPDAVQQWPLAHFLDAVFPRYIAQLRERLSRVAHGCTDSALDLDRIMAARREVEHRAALLSCLHPALYAWNTHRTDQSAAKPPASLWTTLLAALKLSKAQQAQVLQARSDLLASLAVIAAERRQLLSQLALLMLQSTKEGLASCSEILRLQASLGREREAVHSFLFTVCDEVITYQQEALLESVAYPWWPDIWQLACILNDQHAAAQKSHSSRASAQQPPTRSGEGLPDLRIRIPVLHDMGLLPHANAFALLMRPMLAYGAGLRLKGSIVMDPLACCLPAAAMPLPACEQLHAMPLQDVCTGRYLPQSLGAWLNQCQPQLLSLQLLS